MNKPREILRATTLPNMSLRNKRVLLTGANGFVGAHLTAALKKLGANVEELTGDIRAARNVGDFDVVFHLAAITDLKRASENPREVFEVNVSGTLGLLENL